ncbi:MAG: response regulator [Elusimicrobiales bacterium]|nr:response regulator [Elusimicrobiales bacterium]
MPEAKPAAKPKILLIEDSKELSAALAGVLGLKGMEVFTARDGVSGVELARREKPALILLDLMLPKLSGYEVCKILKTDNATWRIPVVVLSTLSRPEQVDRAKAAGADHFVAKPYDLDAVIGEILRFLPKH